MPYTATSNPRKDIEWAASAQGHLASAVVTGSALTSAILYNPNGLIAASLANLDLNTLLYLQTVIDDIVIEATPAP